MPTTPAGRLAAKQGRVRDEDDGQRAQPETVGYPSRQQVRTHARDAEQQQHEARAGRVEADDVGEDWREIGVAHVGGCRAYEDHGGGAQHARVAEQAQLRSQGGSSACSMRGGAAGERRQQGGAHGQAEREHAGVGRLPSEHVGQRSADGHADDARHREPGQHEAQYGGHALLRHDVGHVGEREGQKRA